MPLMNNSYAQMAALPDGSHCCLFHRRRVARYYFPWITSIKLIIGLLIFCLFGFFALKFYSKENRFPLALASLDFRQYFCWDGCDCFVQRFERRNHFSKIKNEIHAYEATAESVPEEKEKSWRIEIEITSVKTTRWQPATGKLLLYVSRIILRSERSFWR